MSLQGWQNMFMYFLRTLDRSYQNHKQEISQHCAIVHFSKNQPQQLNIGLKTLEKSANRDDPNRLNLQAVTFGFSQSESLATAKAQTWQNPLNCIANNM